MKYGFESVLYLWSAQDAWHFANVPIDVSKEIAEVSAQFRRGFGAVRVDVRCGNSSWRTSVFPDKNARCYILPVKAMVRKSENLAAGDLARFEIELVDY